jgi:hypothetical protein
MQTFKARASDLLKNHGWPVAFILAITVIFGYPVLLHRMLPPGHDSIEHMQWYACFANQLWQGELFPRWLENMNAGLGSPSLFVYAPLPYYLAALLRPVSWLLSTVDRENFELGVSVWIAFALSGLGSYLWLGSLVTKRAATIGTVVYLLAPYHLSIDLYTRGAVPELWSFAWIPLALHFATDVIRTYSKSAMAGLIITYALLILTHLFTTLLFTPVLVGYAILLMKDEGRLPALQRFAISLLVGIGLSAAYLLPALEHEKNIPASRLIELRPASRYQGNFLFADPTYNQGTGRDDFLRKISWTTLSVLGAAVLAFLSVSFDPNMDTRPERFWAAVAVASVGMMFPVSGFLWKSIPMLAALQFPWRFNILLTLAATVLVSLGVDHLRSAWRNRRGMCMAGVASMLLLWIAVDVKSVARAVPWKPEVTLLLVGDYLFPAWAKWTETKLLSPSGVMDLSRQIAGRPAQKTEKLFEISGSRSAVFNTEEQHSRWITVRRFYYPGWMAVTELGLQLPVRPSPSTGLIDVQVPGGSNKIHLKLPWSRAEKLGIAVTMLCALISVSLLTPGFWKCQELLAT